MAHSAKFASGKYAWAMCDVCAIRCKYRDLRETTIRGKPTGVLACPNCWDSDHPQNFLSYYVTTDPQALRHARPDTGKEASRVSYPPNNWLNGRPTAFRE
jgi:hypothetical protein